MLAALLLSLCALAPMDAPAARGKGGLEITRDALEVTLFERFAQGDRGRELLELFLKARVLEALASKDGITVSESEVTRQLQEIERRSKAAGTSLADEVARQRMTPAQFREFLRIALLQEKLARKALGIGPGTEVSGDKQEIWLEQELAARGLEVQPPTGDLAGIHARCGEVSITRAEFAHFLGERLGRDDVIDTAWHLLLLQAIEKRMPDLAADARARVVDEELARRRTKHAAEFPAISFEQRLGATGRTLDGLRRDPSVAVAALSRLWIDRTQGPEGVRSTYEKERERFDARYGEAVKAALLFRLGGRFVNDLCPRTFEQAEEELAKLADRIDTSAEFAAQVGRLSEEPATKKQAGDMGWVTRGDARVPGELREALFQLLDTGGTIPAGGRLIGPVRLSSGVALLWASERRPGPGWDAMSECVHEELRRRFLEELMPRDSVELVAPDG